MVIIDEQRLNRLNTFVKRFKLEKMMVAKGLTFYVNNQPVGMMRYFEWKLLEKYSHGVFEFDQAKNEVHLRKWKTEEEITNGIENLLKTLRKTDAFLCLQGWRNEQYDVATKFGDKPIFRIEREATFLFGIKRYGVHINGFVEKDGLIHSVWLQRRAKTKSQFPGLLDIIVSGGLEAGLNPQQAMIKECSEEASMTEEICKRHVKSAGAVSFMYEDELGTHPLIFFCYDANLPETFEPQANDGEVEEFIKCTVDELLDIIVDPKRFKITSAPTVLDFLIRHQLLDNQHGATLLNVIGAIHQNIHEDYPMTSQFTAELQTSSFVRIFSSTPK